MPNAKVLSEKQEIVSELVSRIKSAESGILVDYKGITVAEDTALRSELRKEDVSYTVVKNTLTGRAFEELGMSELCSVLHGTTSLAASGGDPIAPFRIISDCSAKLGERFNIKAAFMNGQVMTEAQISQMAQLGSRDALYSKVLGTMLAAISGLTVCLGQILKNNGGSLEEQSEAAQ